MELRAARDAHPDVSQSVARTEPLGLNNVSLCFLGVTGKYLAVSDNGMGIGESAIQRQRMLAFGDAVCTALGEYVDKS